MSPEAEKAALEAAARIEPRLRRILAWFRVPQEDAEELRQEALLALAGARYAARRLSGGTIWKRRRRKSGSPVSSSP